jgi:hypothetical protein
MITRDSPFSDIKVNGFSAHRVVLADASETFKNMIGDLSEDVRELNLQYPDALVDQLLDYIYYKKYNLTVDLFDLITYMHLTDAVLTQEVVNTTSTDELREIFAKFDIEYKLNIENPSVADYRVLCCLPHEKFMTMLNSAMTNKFGRNKKENKKEFQMFYVAVTLRCLIPWYKNHHLLYVIYHRTMAREEVIGICSTLLHNNMSEYLIWAINGNPSKSNIDLTNQCVEVLKLLGVEIPE